MAEEGRWWRLDAMSVREEDRLVENSGLRKKWRKGNERADRTGRGASLLIGGGVTYRNRPSARRREGRKEDGDGDRWGKRDFISGAEYGVIQSGMDRSLCNNTSGTRSSWDSIGRGARLVWRRPCVLEAFVRFAFSGMQLSYTIKVFLGRSLVDSPRA